MNTEIKNTLFSMVTLRAPQPAVKENESIRFVVRERAVIKGPFDTAIQGISISKWDAMRQATSSFSFINSEENVKQIHPQLFDFSIWLAQSDSSITIDDCKKRSQEINLNNLSIGSAEYASLWDNLFFQVLTQKDFYVKDSIIQMLVAYHLISFGDIKNDTTLDDLKNAKVVLPKELFVESDSVTNAIGITNRLRLEENNGAMTYPNYEMRQIQEASLATISIQNYETLQKELSKAERVYRKEYNDAYATQKKDYDTVNKPLWDAYNIRKEEAKRTWCGIRDPKLPFDPNNPCDQPAYIPYPDIQEFEFKFREELDLPFLQKNLSADSFDTLSTIVEFPVQNAEAARSTSTITGSIDEVTGFSGLNTLINNKISTAKQVVVNSTPVITASYVSVGGIMVGMTSRVVTPFNYTICAKTIPVEKVNFDLKFDVPDSNWQPTNVVCSYQYTSSANTNVDGQPFQTSSVNPAVDNLITIPNIFSAGIPFVVFRNIHSLTVTINFSNGCTKTFTVANFSTIACFTGIMTGDCKGNDTSTNPTINTSNSSQKPFIPSGYGMKQIGIADYKRVEQSVQCYVEGEVANIENVMAREHRSKSTRRLLKTDTTTTDKKEYEKEKTTDTSTTTRFEMQNEVAQVLQESKDVHADAQYNYGDKAGGYSFGLNAGFAAHNSKEDNTRQAITQAKEITQKATERVTNKVMQERVEKIVEEFEENNVHEFDNRKGDKHVVGVYRWVDKIYKNQIVNYGKRLTFEFMIPQPGKLHNLGMTNTEIQETITIPIDPRTFDLPPTTSIPRNLKDYSCINEVTLRYWASYYSVEVTPLPEEVIYVGKSFSKSEQIDGNEATTSKAITDTIKIPDNYIAVSADSEPHQVQYNNSNAQIVTTIQNKNFINEYPVSIAFRQISLGTVYITVKCVLKDEVKVKWQQDCFKAIMDKYFEEVDNYNKKLEDQKSKAVAIKTTNPGFYRQIENIILRKNCISYMIDQTTTARNTYGKDMTNGKNLFTTYEVNVSQDLDNYTALVKFMEQAFEWKIMSYHFYPYYWANRTEWQKMYQFNDSDDALFRSFMQAGMARVIVTVTPGFEEAVRFYMQTGLIWNGGKVPVVEDKLYMSIVDELREPTGKPEGKAWATRLPTSMTILQANSIGLEVKKALPCNCDEVNSTTFENPEMIPCNESFVMNTAQIGGTTGTAKLFGKITGPGNRQAQIELKTAEGLLEDATITDKDGNWELNQIPAGSYTLVLDSAKAYPDVDFMIDEGEKEQEITIENNQVMEVNLSFAKRTSPTL